MPLPRRLVLGTYNREKGLELQALLSPYGFELSTLADWSEAVRVPETGATFAENAALKAAVQAAHLGQWVLGEDSGLNVDALQGAPGVFSARFAGPTADDQANNQRLLNWLADVPLLERTVRYTCHAALSDPLGRIQTRAEACCRGASGCSRPAAAVSAMTHCSKWWNTTARSANSEPR